MAHRSLHLIVACAALALAGGARPAAQARERIAFVSLVDRATGMAPATVAARDLTIREDGVAREILRVSPASGPMPIAVLVDTSAAAEPTIADVRTALTTFVDGLGDLGPVTIVGYGERPTVLAAYTSSRPALATGIGRVFARPGSGATLIEAVDEIAKGLTSREGERAAIVVLSPMTLEQSGGNYMAALSQLEASGASLHVIALSRPGQSSLDDGARQRDMLLDRGVRATGGVRRDVLASMAFGPALRDLAQALTHQVRVVYARPQTLIPPKTFDVTAVAPGLVAYGAMAKGQPR